MCNDICMYLPANCHWILPHFGCVCWCPNFCFKHPTTPTCCHLISWPTDTMRDELLQEKFNSTPTLSSVWRHDTGGMTQKTWHRRHDTGDMTQETWHRRHDMGGMTQKTWHRRHDTGGMTQETWHRRHDTGGTLDHWFTCGTSNKVAGVNVQL